MKFIPMAWKFNFGLLISSSSSSFLGQPKSYKYSHYHDFLFNEKLFWLVVVSLRSFSEDYSKSESIKMQCFRALTIIKSVFFWRNLRATIYSISYAFSEYHVPFKYMNRDINSDKFFALNDIIYRSHFSRLQNNIFQGSWLRSCYCKILKTFENAKF